MRSTAKIAASTGLPFNVASRTFALVPPIPSHREIGLEPTIQSHMTGSQRAGEVRTELSRLRKKRPATPMANIRKARFGFILGICKSIASASARIQRLRDAVQDSNHRLLTEPGTFADCEGGCGIC